MENKPKTSSYKRLKPYIKGFQIPFVLAIFGAIISAVITVIGPDKLKEITNTITEGITPTKMGTIPGIDLDKVASIAMTLAVLYLCHFSDCGLLTKLYRCDGYTTLFTTFPYSYPKENQQCPS